MEKELTPPNFKPLKPGLISSLPLNSVQHCSFPLYFGCGTLTSSVITMHIDTPSSHLNSIADVPCATLPASFCRAECQFDRDARQAPRCTLPHCRFTKHLPQVKIALSAVRHDLQHHAWMAVSITVLRWERGSRSRGRQLFVATAAGQLLPSLKQGQLSGHLRSGALTRFMDRPCDDPSGRHRDGGFRHRFHGAGDSSSFSPSPKESILFNATRVKASPSNRDPAGWGLGRSRVITGGRSKKDETRVLGRQYSLFGTGFAARFTSIQGAGRGKFHRPSGSDGSGAGDGGDLRDFASHQQVTKICRI